MKKNYRKWLPFSIAALLMLTTPQVTWWVYHFITVRLSEHKLVPMLNVIGLVCGLLYLFALWIKSYQHNIQWFRFLKVAVVSAIISGALAMTSSRLLPGERVHMPIFMMFGFWLFALTANKRDWFLRFMHTTLLMFAIIAIKELIESRTSNRLGDPFDLGIDIIAVVIGLLLRDFWESLGR